MTTKDQIFSHIQESTPLPSLPHILIKLIDVCDNEEAPISTVGPIVAQDTAMSSKVLRLVNSAYFDLQRTFSDLDKAVVFLGASTIKDLAINASVQQVISGLKNSNGFNIGHFWYNSLLSATLGRRIAQAINHTNTEEVYLAGLLHNIGHLILFNTFPKEYTLVQEKRVNGPSECTEEERLIGVNHCEAGAWLIRKWKISPFIADAAYYHHHAPEYIKDGFPLVKITFLADRIAEGAMVFPTLRRAFAQPG